MRGPGALYPSAQGNLTLLAADNVGLSQQVYTLQYGGTSAYNLGLIDASADALPSALTPYGVNGSSNFFALWHLGYLSGIAPTMLHSADPLHAADSQPVRIYALQGDVLDGIQAPNGFQYRSLQVLPNKPALIYAGRDIVNLSFVGQQLRDADVTRISAGRDIYDTPITAYFNNNTSRTDPGAYQLVPALLLGGPGTFLIEAGRNIGPLSSQQEIATTGSSLLTGDIRYTGIDTIGNAINPYLPHESADVDVLFGVSPGIAVNSFMASYVDGTTNGVNLMPDLVTFMERREAGQVVDTGYAQDKITVSLTSDQARQLFNQQPDYVQRQFVTEAVFKILAQVGADYNNPASPYYGQYARGYTAVDTLFPAAYGYTANGSGQGGHQRCGEDRGYG
ncbi:filamentous hemagglutinin family protein [Dyella terrae]|nr:filamentous hemagglutinin family protein [Dyella terrae]